MSTPIPPGEMPGYDHTLDPANNGESESDALAREGKTGRSSG